MKTFKFYSILAICIAFLATTNVSQAQTTPAKNVVSAQRVFPKIDKVLEFEKALATHAQKYHSGDHAWRVFDIQTGPDFGGYHIVEGPKSWESEETRGDLGKEHLMDWHKNVAIYLTDRQSASYSVYIDSLSTVALTDFSEKVQLTHVYPKVGHGDDVVNILKKLKKTWVLGGVSVAVYAANASGPAQYVISQRLKQGLKEKATDFRKPFKVNHEAANGEGAYDQYLKDCSEFIKESWTELLVLRNDLGSK